jgi:hypothetical protein
MVKRLREEVQSSVPASPDASDPGQDLNDDFIEHLLSRLASPSPVALSVVDSPETHGVRYEDHPLSQAAQSEG